MTSAVRNNVHGTLGQKEVREIRAHRVKRLTWSVFLAPVPLLMMMVSGPPMEQMFFSRAPLQTGTVETVKSWTDGGWNVYHTVPLDNTWPTCPDFHVPHATPFSTAGVLLTLTPVDTFTTMSLTQWRQLSEIGVIMEDHLCQKSLVRLR